METNEGDCRVVVVGAGAGGTLVATHLVTALSSRFRVELVDPAPGTGRGQAYSTTDERHLLKQPDWSYGDSWSGRDRTLHEVILRDISVVQTFPAYPQTSVIARSKAFNPALPLALAKRVVGSFRS